MNKKTQEEVKNLELMSINFRVALFQKKLDEETIANILQTTSNLDRQIIRLFYKKNSQIQSNKILKINFQVIYVI